VKYLNNVIEQDHRFVEKKARHHRASSKSGGRRTCSRRARPG
jgi:transposase-like protein